MGTNGKFMGISSKVGFDVDRAHLGADTAAERTGSEQGPAPAEEALEPASARALFRPSFSVFFDGLLHAIEGPFWLLTARPSPIFEGVNQE